MYSISSRSEHKFHSVKHMREQTARPLPRVQGAVRVNLHYDWSVRWCLWPMVAHYLPTSLSPRPQLCPVRCPTLPHRPILNHCPGNHVSFKVLHKAPSPRYCGLTGLCEIILQRCRESEASFSKRESRTRRREGRRVRRDRGRGEERRGGEGLVVRGVECVRTPEPKC